MTLNVRFKKHDYVNLRVCYTGMDEHRDNTYCFQDGTWYQCTLNGELGSPLKGGLEIKIHDSTGIIGNTTIKDKRPQA